MIDLMFSAVLFLAPAPVFDYRHIYRVTFEKPSFECVLNTSAYWHMDPVDASGTGITSTGNKCIPYRTLAVDPSIIPYGSEVYFYSTKESYIADDCGGAIEGYMADKAMDSRKAALTYGRRNERVKVTLPHEVLKVVNLLEQGGHNGESVYWPTDWKIP